MTKSEIALQKDWEETLQRIEREEREESQRKDTRQNLINYIEERKEYQNNHPEELTVFLGRNQMIDDYDYQMEVDTNLSLKSK